MNVLDQGQFQHAPIRGPRLAHHDGNPAQPSRLGRTPASLPRDDLKTCRAEGGHQDGLKDPMLANRFGQASDSLLGITPRLFCVGPQSVDFDPLGPGRGRGFHATPASKKGIQSSAKFPAAHGCLLVPWGRRG